MSNRFDAVITWVDGSDPIHINKRNQYLNSREAGTTSCGVLDWRFVEIGEVRYTIYSIRKYAPWIRNIYLVTDNQCPEWLTKETQNSLGVILIDHSEIFRDYLHCLPTFNTMSINSLLHTIPGLANNYIVFNDDCFFIDQVRPEDFYIGDSNIIRGQIKPIKPGCIKRIKRVVKSILRTKFLKGSSQRQANPLINAVNIVGLEKEYVDLAHAPDANRVDVLESFYSKRPGFLGKNVSYRFRNINQTSSAAIFPQIMLKHKRAIISEGNDSVMIIPGKGGLKGLSGQREKFDTLKRGTHGKKLLCFQDLAILRQESPAEFQEVINWMEETIMKDNPALVSK